MTRFLRYLPVVPFLALVAFYAVNVDRYPSKIGVTQRSCADPANSGRLTFRQKIFCVTPAEQTTWNSKWQTIYILLGIFVVCVGISSAVRRAHRPKI